MDPTPPPMFRAGPNAPAGEDFPERRLSEAVGQWDANIAGSPAAVIRAACDALVAGLDSPALRDLAGLPASSRRTDVDEIIAAMLDELGIPRLHDLKQGRQIGRRGKIVGRPASDRLRLSVVASPECVGGFQVQIFVNEVEMTAAGAGMGMDPYEVLIPENRFVATNTSCRIPVARCGGCGIYGCAVTDVSIVRDGDAVHWDWHEETPMDRGVTFRALDYDTEVARVAADVSWETPDRTAGRLILALADREALRRNELVVAWVDNDYRDPSRFCVCLTYAQSHQIFVYTRWDGRSPSELAHETVRLLAEEPRSWHAEWNSMKPNAATPPIAGQGWRRHGLP